MAVQIRKLDSTAPDFATTLSALLAFEAETDDAIELAVAGILRDVKARGDAAVLDYTNKFDRIPNGGATSMAQFDVQQAELEAALAALPDDQRAALQVGGRPRARVPRAPEENRRRALPSPSLTAPCWASASRRWTGSASMSRAARRRIRRRC